MNKNFIKNYKTLSKYTKLEKRTIGDGKYFFEGRITPSSMRYGPRPTWSVQVQENRIHVDSEDSIMWINATTVKVGEGAVIGSQNGHLIHSPRLRLCASNGHIVAVIDVNFPDEDISMIDFIPDETVERLLEDGFDVREVAYNMKLILDWMNTYSHDLDELRDMLEQRCETGRLLHESNDALDFTYAIDALVKCGKIKFFTDLKRTYIYGDVIAGAVRKSNGRGFKYESSRGVIKAGCNTVVKEAVAELGVREHARGFTSSEIRTIYEKVNTQMPATLDAVYRCLKRINHE